MKSTKRKSNTRKSKKTSQKAKRNKAFALLNPFDMTIFLTRILKDLRHSLGALYTPLVESLVEGPEAFRGVVDNLLAHEAEAYVSIRRYAALRQVHACISKYGEFGATTEANRRATAQKAFLAAEFKCKLTNKRLAYYAQRPLRMSKSLRMVITMAQDEILRCLGGPPDFDMFENASFGPGLTYGMAFEDRDLFYKINGNQDVTPACKNLALEVITKLHPRWGAHLARNGYSLSCVPGNRISFVPKSFKTFRTIGIEPSLNVWLQKAVDHDLKQKLRRMNLRLRSQEFSSDLIRSDASSTLPCATLDLKAASDTIAYELVKLMLPREWFELLDVLRSPCYTMDKGETWNKYHKFSSMGNACTFPLESMIFMALTRACVRYCGASTKAVRVYGDDVIVPVQAAALVIEVFKFCGFSINTDKSFCFGPFRETCGVDLLYGVDVRPVYVREVPRENDNVANLFNRLLCHAYGFTFPSSLEYLYSLVSRPLFGPAYFGWTSTERLEQRPWQEWYEGRNTLCDAYFFAPSFTLPSFSSLECSKGEFDYQTSACHLERWYRPRKPRDGVFAEDLRYAAFLYGIEDGMPLEMNGRLRVKKEVFYGPWPELGWWPDIYPNAVDHSFTTVGLPQPVRECSGTLA